MIDHETVTTSRKTQKNTRIHKWQKHINKTRKAHFGAEIKRSADRSERDKVKSFKNVEV